METKNNIVFHSTHCPKCKVVEMKLKQKGITYTENNDVDVMLGLGIKSAPCLQVNDTLYPFKEAVDYINSL